MTTKHATHIESLWNRSTSNDQMMYNTWSFHGEQRDTSSWDHEAVKQRISRTPREVQASIPTAKEVTNQDLFNGNNSADSLNGGLTTETEGKGIETPQFHITIDKPIRHITPCNVSFPLWSNPGDLYSNGRRASDSALVSSARSSGRSAAAFSALPEEIRMNESAAGVKEADRYNSGVSSLNGRRFSDGCFSSVPNYNGYKKVSVVLPQPRRAISEETYRAENSTNDNLECADSSKNEEDNHWKELVAKAKGFKSIKGLTANKERGMEAKDVNGNIIRSSDIEDVCSDVSSEASFSSNSSYQSLSENDSTECYSLTVKPISSELANFKCEDDTNVKSNPARANRHISIQPSFGSSSKETHLRRYSLATSCSESSQDPKKTAKLSGYSTQSALEQARQLLGKLQSEGKNKNKKERLEELSTALKWILEELNRIETPDRELVSLFISLRAKIVNLKADLKAEEFYATPVDPSEETENLPRMQHLAINDCMTNARSRRFSWC